jgi:polar amino acid transport system substrate-binding protein
MTCVVTGQTLTIYTSEFPPFNFMEDGKLTGMATEVVDAVMKETGIPYVIQSNAWSRSMQLVQEEPNTLIYPLSRQEKREALFHWVGVITPAVTHSIFALKSRTDIRVQNLEDLKKYTIGTNSNDARETYLSNKGFDLDKFDRLSGDDAHDRNYQKLKIGRIDLWPMPDAVAAYVVKKAGDDPNLVLQKVFEFTELSQGGYYLATSLSISQEELKKISAQLEAFRQSPEYQAILGKWGM